MYYFWATKWTCFYFKYFSIIYISYNTINKAARKLSVILGLSHWVCCGTECHVPEKKLKPKPHSSSWIYGESKQYGPEQHSYFGQTAMLPPGENLKFCSTFAAAVAWWGEQLSLVVKLSPSRWAKQSRETLRRKWMWISWHLCPQVSKYSGYFSFTGKLNHPALSFTHFFSVSLSFPQAAPDSTSSWAGQFSKVEDTMPDKGFLRH